MLADKRQHHVDILSGFTLFYPVSKSLSIAFKMVNFITDKAIYGTVHHTNRVW